MGRYAINTLLAILILVGYTYIVNRISYNEPVKVVVRDTVIDKTITKFRVDSVRETLSKRWGRTYDSLYSIYEKEKSKSPIVITEIEKVYIDTSLENPSLLDTSKTNKKISEYRLKEPVYTKFNRIDVGILAFEAPLAIKVETTPIPRTVKVNIKKPVWGKYNKWYIKYPLAFFLGYYIGRQ